jgi:acetoin utilization deacetylase AcuC-like enzyme
VTTLLISHPACLAHDAGPGHVERPERLRAVLAALDAPEFTTLERRAAPLADVEALERAHEPAYVEAVLAAIPAQGYAAFDADTIVSPGSGEAALRAAGAACAAVDAVLAGEVANGFCAVRPPGHHAERARAMGFCLFDTIAVAALHAQAAHGVGRVAIVDFDVHHGNGTQDIFWDNPNVLFASTHQRPLYPGSGARSERGAHDQILNVPLQPGTDGAMFRHAIEATILPALELFAPELILVSAGFDAHRRDPLANLDLEAADFAWVTSALANAAGRYCGGRLVSTLEGGYDLQALAESAAAHVGALMRA